MRLVCTGLVALATAACSGRVAEWRSPDGKTRMLAARDLGTNESVLDELSDRGGITAAFLDSPRWARPVRLRFPDCPLVIVSPTGASTLRTIPGPVTVIQPPRCDQALDLALRAAANPALATTGPSFRLGARLFDAQHPAGTLLETTGDARLRALLATPPPTDSKPIGLSIGAGARIAPDLQSELERRGRTERVELVRLSAPTTWPAQSSIGAFIVAVETVDEAKLAYAAAGGRPVVWVGRRFDFGPALHIGSDEEAIGATAGNLIVRHWQSQPGQGQPGPRTGLFASRSRYDRSSQLYEVGITDALGLVYR